ncbi:MAG: 30S ribosomal protein S20 [Pseudomonadota bacterium]|nr:30S ribosomal protein S20 [Pseudomonadota bacterium]
MAHSLSAKKRIRKTVRQTTVNMRRLSSVRTSIRKVETAISDGNKLQAETAFKLAQPELMCGAQKGVIPRNTISRKISRLSKQIKGMSS